MNALATEFACLGSGYVSGAGALVLAITGFLFGVCTGMCFGVWVGDRRSGGREE